MTVIPRMHWRLTHFEYFLLFSKTKQQLQSLVMSSMLPIEVLTTYFLFQRQTVMRESTASLCVLFHLRLYGFRPPMLCFTLQ